MDRMTQLYAPVVGRILVGGYFLWSAIGVALDSSNLTALSGLFVLIEALGGIALVAGYKTKTAALALVLFTLLVTFIEGHFVLANIAIIGGLLYISAYGYNVWPRRGR
jgi:uncharacterized membrane protein YphA (DoxX/SURF4 family)